MDPVDEHFRDAVAALPRDALGTAVSPHVGPDRLLELFDSQAGSRHVDLVARTLGARGVGFYSIGSAGHESDAMVAAALRPGDPALLHYRSGAFYVERARQRPGHDPLRDLLLGVVASADEPVSGGRHKVLGHADLAVIPQTSTIASQLPRAVGLAFAIGRAARLGLDSGWATDSVVLCSFGDASANHSTTTGAVNTALHAAHQGLPMPLLLLCEDNGIGISVRTPEDWVERSYADRAGLRYLSADGSDPEGVVEAAETAAVWARERRTPVFLHLRTVRLMGHAGSDAESGYRSRAEIVGDYARDPLLATARRLVDTGVCAPAEVLRRYEAKRDEVAAIAEEVLTRPRLAGRSDVLRPLAPHRPDAVARHVRRAGPVVDGAAPATVESLTLAQSVNRSLAEEMTRDPGVLVFGQDVARKGGVYGVTKGLRGRFGGARVFDTLLDEQAILGTALGAGLAGLLPIPEIQYLAYLHNAADQLRGEASTLSFFSNGRYRNPMVVRIAGYAYQKGFGGHFHNDNSVAALRDIPGVVVASPARPDDAAAMLRTCVAAARVDGRVAVFLEPIALYHTRDLYDEGDGAWLTPYPEAADPASHVPVGSAREHGAGTDLTLVTFGNGLPMSLRVARRLRRRGIDPRVLDLRWLAPLPEQDLLASARATGRVLVVDETRRSGGVSEAVTAVLLDHGFDGRVARVTSADSFIPLGPAAAHVLLDETAIEDAAMSLLER